MDSKSSTSFYHNNHKHLKKEGKSVQKSEASFCWRVGKEGLGEGSLFGGGWGGGSLRDTVLAHVLRVAVRDAPPQLLNVAPQLAHLLHPGPQHAVALCHVLALILLPGHAHGWTGDRGGGGWNYTRAHKTLTTTQVY